MNYRKENVIEFKTRKMTVQGANEVWFDQMFTVEDYTYELHVAADLMFIGLQLRNYFAKIREGLGPSTAIENTADDSSKKNVLLIARKECCPALVF